MARAKQTLAQAAPTTQVVGEILEIALADIDVSGRLRPVDPVWAQALAGIMAADGQHQPIEVCQLPGRAGFRLVAGGHRVAAAALNGWTAIRAVLVSADAVQRRTRELSENLWRRDLDPIDRAAHVAELVELKRAAAGLAATDDGRSVSAQTRWAKVLKSQADDASANIARAYGWADEIAEAAGLSRRSIYNDLELHRGLRPDVVEALRGRPIASNAGQLRALAKLDEREQRAALQLIVDGQARGATDALGILRQKPKPDAEKKAWSAFFGGWSRMSARRRKDALRELAEQGLPRGVRIVFDGDAQ